MLLYILLAYSTLNLGSTRERFPVPGSVFSYSERECLHNFLVIFRRFFLCNAFCFHACFCVIDGLFNSFSVNCELLELNYIFHLLVMDFWAFHRLFPGRQEAMPQRTNDLCFGPFIIE